MGIFDRMGAAARGAAEQSLRNMEQRHELDALRSAARKVGIDVDSLTPAAFRALTQEQRQGFLRLVPRHVEDLALQQQLAARIGFRHQQTPASVDAEIQGMRQASAKMRKMLGWSSETAQYPAADLEGNPLAEDEYHAMVRFIDHMGYDAFVSGKATWSPDLGLFFDDGVSEAEQRTISAGAERVFQREAKQNQLGASVFQRVYGRPW